MKLKLTYLFLLSLISIFSCKNGHNHSDIPVIERQAWAIAIHGGGSALDAVEKTINVMLSGTGASQFAKEQGLEIVPPEYFYTDRRYNDLQDALKKENMGKKVFIYSRMKIKN